MKSSFLEEFSNESSVSGISSNEEIVEEDITYLEKQKRKKKKIFIVCIIALVIVIPIIIFSKLVTIPDFENNLSEIAIKWGRDNDIVIKEEQEYNNKVKEGFIISQSIPKNKKIFKKSTVVIKVSLGKNPNEFIDVPDLKNSSATEIKLWKDSQELRYVTIKEEYSDTIQKGNIISYEFESVTTNETNFTRSDKLNIIVSKGTEAVMMEDFKDKSKDEVIKWCNDHNLNYKIIENFSRSVDPSIVISQSIKAGTEVEKEQEIIFEISKGEEIIIPNYSNISSEDAPSVNEKIKVKIKFVYNMKVNYGKLINQSIKAGTKQSIDDNEIILTYSLGVPYFSSMVGKNESEIAKVFYEYNQKGVNFTYSIKYTNSSLEKGEIVSTSKSNEFVTMKEHIEIYVSNGVNHNIEDNLESNVNDDN